MELFLKDDKKNLENSLTLLYHCLHCSDQQCPAAPCEHLMKDFMV